MRVMSIDYGLARTGVAISDLSGFLATPYAVVPSFNEEKLLNGLYEIVLKEKPQKVIMGLPSRTDGKESEIQAKVKAFAEKLSQKLNMQIEFIDEKFTTVIASQKLHENSKKAKSQKSVIDAAAAAVMLQDWLDRNRQKL